MKKNEILIITEHYWPENFRINDLALRLFNNGMKITVLTGFPNYPSGSIYQDYKGRFFKKEKHNNIDIIRIPIIPRGRAGKFMLILNYLSFVISATFFMLINGKSKYDKIFIFETSPVTVAIPGILYKKIINKKAVLAMWVLDFWPDYAYDALNLKSRPIKYIIKKITSWIYTNVNYLLCQSQSYCEKMKEYRDDGILYYPNWAEDIFEKQSKPKNSAMSANKIILFAGNVGELQNLESLVLAVQLLVNERKLIDKLIIRIIGGGRNLPNLKKMVNGFELNDYFEFIDELPITEMPAKYNEADFLFISLLDKPIFNATIPGKLQSYMAFGRPIIGFISGEAARIIKESGAGFVANPSDVNELVRVIEHALSLDSNSLKQISENAKIYYNFKFSSEKAVKQLVELYG